MTTAHTYRPHHLAQGRCAGPCGRKKFLSRTDAKRAARAMHPNLCLRPVRCAIKDSPFWHYEDQTAQRGGQQ